MGDKSHNIKITPEKIVEMLEQEHTDLSVEDAMKVLAFLKKIARITVSKYLEINDC